MSPLETRRFKTAKKIQAAAIELAVRDGLPNVTTEAIARHAGISTRTFFNYYPYKEAALMGPPPDYPPEASEIFIAGKGRLIEDLGLLIEAHLARYLNERELIGAMLALSDKDPSWRRCATAPCWRAVRRCVRCCIGGCPGRTNA